MLVTAGADVNIADEYDYLPIHYACAYSNAPMVRYLMENAKANNNELNTQEGNGLTPLISY